MAQRPRDLAQAAVKAIGKRRPRSDSRARVMAAAGRLFSRKGFAATSVDEIATTAKASPSSIYWHFKGGKDDILLAVLEEATQTYTRRILDAVRQGADIREKADIFLRAAEEQLASGPETLRLIMQMALERANVDKVVRDRIRAIYRNFRATIAGEMTGDLPELDPSLLPHAATVQIALFEGIFLQWQLDPDEVDLKQAFAFLRTIALAGLTKILEEEDGK